MMLTLSGCGGGGGGSDDPLAATPPAPQMGDLTITMTDAEGDFAAYIVDVNSIRLRRANGDLVETLPLTTRIDFTQLSEVSEFLTVATVPAGDYESVVMELDYSDADILVQADDGAAVAADVVDADGNPVTTLTVTLELDAGTRIRITPGTVHAFSLDFDLEASNRIDHSATPPTVTVEPVLLAKPELDEGRSHRARGLLAAVDEAARTVTIKVRPFHHRAGSFGRFSFRVDDDTAWEIDGNADVGSAGLTVLADLPEDTPVVAAGPVVDGELVADTVLAGSSVYWSDAEVVHGVVRARSGDTLTVSGAAIAFADGRYQFRRELTVLVGPDTVVGAPRLEPGSLDHVDISVGQRILASGSFASEGTLDATTGRVRLLQNRFWGDVVSTSPLVVDLALVNGRRPVAFDFTGTGMTMADDADPDVYEVDAGALGLLTLDPGDLVQLRGRVNRFGFAPPDFLAETVVDVAAEARGATATIAWPEGTATPFVALSPARLDLDLSDARAQVLLQGRWRDLPIEPAQLALTAPNSGLGIYAVRVRGTGTVSLYREFAELTRALTAELDAGATLHRISAHGRYTDGDDTLTTVRASFVLRSADAAGGGNG
jgi:hypothetical protein